MAKQLTHKPDPFQQAAIDSTARGIRIVAPAGSGKSETLARRVAKRIEKDGIDHRRILILTFDNAAKKSLNDFLSQVLDRRHVPQVRSLNQHGLDILRSYFPEENATAIDGDASHPASQVVGKYNYQGRALPLLAWDGVVRPLVDVFKAMKEQGFYPGRDGELQQVTRWLREDCFRLPKEGETAALDDLWGMPSPQAMDDNNTGQIRSIIEMATAFEAQMRQMDAMQLIDQKARAANRLFGSPESMHALQAEFDEIIVDECQDISRLDAMLICATVGPKSHIVLAGDDDQTLYEWRNAHSLYLRRPEIVFGDDVEFETIHLNLNYRSPQEILSPAVKLIAHNVERIEKSPSSAVTEPGTLEVLPVSSTREIETHLVDSIRQEIASGRAPLDIAVLCHHRNEHDQRSPLEKALKQAGIPVTVVNKQERPTKPGVWVRTFQKDKGRQWPVVFIPAANDRDVPDNESIRKGEVEAVRRRFYVAMTRASEKLVISYVRGGDVDRIDYTAESEVVGTNGASRFLFEAGVVQAAPEAGMQQRPGAVASEAPAATNSSEPKTTPVLDNPSVVERTEIPRSQLVATIDPVPEPAIVRAPTPSPVPLGKRRQPKDREPRAEDTRNIAKAKREWDERDYDFAIIRAWTPIENALGRIVKLPKSDSLHSRNVRLIDTALERRMIDVAWKDRLHLWRQVRNQASHQADESPRFSQAQYMDYGFQLVDGASEFFEHLAERNAPKQMVLETQDEFLTRLTHLVTMIQMDKPLPKYQRPIRAIRFDPELSQFDVLSMQLLMVLRDVRFYIPDEYRWSSSPIVGKYAVEAAGYLPANFRTRGNNRLRLQPGEQLNQLMARFDRMVQQECGGSNPGQFVCQRLEDGLKLENGNFHAGLKLNPKARM